MLYGRTRTFTEEESTVAWVPESSMIYVNGVCQTRQDYVIRHGNIVWLTPPPCDAVIEVDSSEYLEGKTPLQRFTEEVWDGDQDANARGGGGRVQK